MINEITIEINKTNYIIKPNFKTFMLVEKQLKQKISTIDFEYMENLIIMIHSSLKVNNKNFKLSFDDLVDYIDENPSLLQDVGGLMQDDDIDETDETKKK